jgi:hypothetical protein
MRYKSAHVGCGDIFLDLPVHLGCGGIIENLF